MNEVRGISGVGCSLADYIYSNIDFSADRFRKYLSTKASDGGLEPGKLVFLDDFQSQHLTEFGERFQDIATDRDAVPAEPLVHHMASKISLVTLTGITAPQHSIWEALPLSLL